MLEEKLTKIFMAALSLIFTCNAAHDLAHAEDGAPLVITSIGEYKDQTGNPTYKIGQDGTVDWYTNIGYAQYGEQCLTCHGPNGLGSKFAPSLVSSFKSLSYSDFSAIVSNGRKPVNAAPDLVMPSFARNKDVMCYLDAIYVYLRARADGVLEPVRPVKTEAEPADWSQQEDACLG
jgi:methanol metabolism-related c-type cytochrome